MGDNMKVLCIGHISYDITFPVDKFILENTKNRIENRVECGGGPASNAAYLLGKYGVETYIMGIVGNDYYADKIIKEFEDVNVNIKYLLKLDDYDTTNSVIIANKENGSRTILTYKDNSKKYPVIDIDFVPDIIHIDGQEPEISNYMLEKFPNAISVIDAGRNTEEIITLAKKVNYLVCSKEFAENMTNLKFNKQDLSSYSKIYIKMKEIFNNNIIITLESEGSMALIDEKLKLVPSINVKAIDSTGAGDLFHGAFVYSLANNYTLEKSLKFSNIVGGLSVTKIGGRYSVPTFEEINKYYVSR